MSSFEKALRSVLSVEDYRHSVVVRYATPIVGLSIATVISLLFWHVFGPDPAIRIVYLIAILASAWWGGYGPGLLASLAGLFLIPHLFNQNFDRMQVILVLLVSLLVSRVSALRNRTEEELKKAKKELEDRVRQRTAELQRSNEELRRLNDDLNQFAYSASHDLREPLRMISIYSQLLEREYRSKLDERAALHLSEIIAGAGRMRMLLEGLFVYAQLIRSTPQRVGEVDSEAVLKKSLQNLSFAIRESGATVDYSDLPQLQMNEVHLLQLFQNLVGNAIKYRSSEAPRVVITAHREQQNWKICVKDNGIGVPAQHAGEIFRMFKRLNGAHPRDGSGMGLAICERIIERYGGQIWVESPPDKGSVFCFTVPL